MWGPSHVLGEARAQHGPGGNKTQCKSAKTQISNGKQLFTNYYYYYYYYL